MYLYNSENEIVLEHVDYESLFIGLLFLEPGEDFHFEVTE